LFDRFGNLLAEIFVALQAMKLDRGVGLFGADLHTRWGIGTCEDLRRLLEAAVQQYCGRQPSTRNFVSLTEALAASVRAALREQANNETEVAA
jgi:hypothetical protein